MNCWYESRKDQVKEKLIHYSFHPDLQQFREASEQQKVFQMVLEKEETQLAIAFSDSHIVGYAILVAPDKNERWSTYSFIRELGALEVIPAYREKGVATQLLHNLFSDEAVEASIVIALEYYWHWDVSNHMISVYKYKEMLRHVLSHVYFEEVKTDEEDIAINPVNFMMARMGKFITFKQKEQFFYLAYPYH